MLKPSASPPSSITPHCANALLSLCVCAYVCACMVCLCVHGVCICVSCVQMLMVVRLRSQWLPSLFPFPSMAPLLPPLSLNGPSLPPLPSLPSPHSPPLPLNDPFPLSSSSMAPPLCLITNCWCVGDEYPKWFLHYCLLK